MKTAETSASGRENFHRSTGVPGNLGLLTLQTLGTPALDISFHVLPDDLIGYQSG